MVFENGKAVGRNTDVFGFSGLLADDGIVSLKSQTVVVLGAGGAARAVVAAVLALGAARVVLVNRTLEKAKALAKFFGGRVHAADWSELPSALGERCFAREHDKPRHDGRAALNVDLTPLAKQAAVADIVYRPLETPLLAQAKARGLKAIDGLGMLLHQARPGFAAWFGVEPNGDASVARASDRGVGRPRLMLLVGLTGSIGMGKSETAKMFARHGVPVCDSDATVHALYEKGGAAVEPVGAAFPDVVVDGRIDRERLSRHVVGKPEAMRKLELIVHPLVAAAQRAFLERADASGRDDGGARHSVVVRDRRRRRGSMRSSWSRRRTTFSAGAFWNVRA